MRLITGSFIWMLRLTLFGAFFVFALHNRHTVAVYDWFGNPIQTGMAVALGLAALLGLLLGIIIPLPRLWRYRQERNACREHMRTAGSNPSDSPSAGDVRKQNARAQDGTNGN